MTGVPTKLETHCPKLPWMIDFHSTEDGKVLNNQLKAAFAPNRLEHLSCLHPQSRVGKFRLTQMVCVIAPKTTKEEGLKLLEAGMTVALLKTEFFSVEEFREMVAVLRRASESFDAKLGYSYPLAIAMDLSPPGVRTGRLKAPTKEISVEQGATIKLTSNPAFARSGSKDIIYVNNITEIVKPGDSLILGNASLSALEVVRDIIECVVERAGKILTNQTVLLPNIPLEPPPPTISELYLKIVPEMSLDLVVIPPSFLEITKNLVGPTIFIVAKIDSSQFDDFESTIEKVDGIFVDSEKLLVTMQERVFVLQKMLTAKCNKVGKPVLTSINCNYMTKSHVFDIANAIIDGIDALVLPPDVEIINCATAICKSAEAAVYQKQLFDDLISLMKPPVEAFYGMSMAAVEMSFSSNAAAIVVLTTSGRCAKMLSRYRPRCPIIAVTKYGRVARQLRVFRGVLPLVFVKECHPVWVKDVEIRVQLGITFGKHSGLIRMGDAVVVLTGSKPGSGFTNDVKIVYASQYDTQPEEKEDVCNKSCSIVKNRKN